MARDTHSYTKSFGKTGFRKSYIYTDKQNINIIDKRAY